MLLLLRSAKAKATTMTAAEMSQCLAVPDPRARAPLPMRQTTTQTTMKMALALTARMIMTCVKMDTNRFKLRNAVVCAAGGGRPQALTRGNARFAAAFAAKLLRERGYISRRDDAAEVLAWLESEPFGPPSEPLWRRLGQVR